MKYFGIQTVQEPKYIWWIANSEEAAWRLFFQFPDKDGDKRFYRMPTYEARKAYEAIGYKCVELEVKIKKLKRTREVK